MNLMGVLPALFAMLMPLCCQREPDADRYLDERVKSRVEVRAIRSLLKDFAQDKQKDENIGIIIGYEDTGFLVTLSHRPAMYMAHFKYRHGDESILVHYHLSPVREKYADTAGNDSFWAFRSFLEKIAAGGGGAFFDGAKQMEMPLPKGLKNDSLLSKLRKRPLYNARDDGMWSRYCGFRTKNGELIQWLDMHSEKLNMMINSGIVDPIHMRLVYHETPAEWIKEYKEKYCESTIAGYDKWLEGLGIKK
jgi:hypothetical protein